jgi:hypothetical protein
MSARRRAFGLLKTQGGSICSILQLHSSNQHFHSQISFSFNNQRSQQIQHFSKPSALIRYGQIRHISVVPGLELNPDEEENNNKKDQKSEDSPRSRWKEIALKCLETAGITISTLAMLALAGWGYQELYYMSTVKKIEEAFKIGDPSFVLSAQTKRTGETEGWVDREGQALLNDVIAGKLVGRYYLLIGEKGTGKTSMLLEAMRLTQGANCTVIDAHADPEIFRIRLGRALNFQFFEDYIGALFSLRGPRDTTALLDIERAMNKLEEVAFSIKKKTHKPLVLIINNFHLIRDDDEGQHLIELLQQKAEALSATGLVTIIFNSDDYWVYERLKKLGTRLDVVTIRDLSRQESVSVLQRARRQNFKETLSLEDANHIYNLVGGRPQHLTAVAAQKDAITACHKLIDRERTWFLNQCGLLGMDMDDDVMESGKFSTSAMLLMRALVEMDRRRHKETGEINLDFQDHQLPQVPLWIARKIMTRPDYIQVYDNLNIFTIDSNSFVRADSVPMMHAFHEIADMPGFDDLLVETQKRVSDIESLGRTRELVAKDLVLNGTYKIDTKTEKGSALVSLLQEEEEDDDDDFIETTNELKITEELKSWWWSKRNAKFMSHKHDKQENKESSGH